MGNRTIKVVIVPNRKLWTIHSFQENRQTKERTHWHGRYKGIPIGQSVYQGEWAGRYNIAGDGQE